MINKQLNLKFICLVSALICGAMTTNLQASSEQTAESFVQSLVLFNEAVSTQANDGSPEDALELRRQALSQARETSKTDLNEHLSGLGDKFYSLFIDGLELQIAGQTEHDNQRIASGQEALSSWQSWYASNLDSIRRTN